MTAAASGAAPVAGLVDRVVEHRGRRLRYVSFGQGPPLLLCHGFMGSAENFETWYAELAPRRTVVIPDLPGCGASDPLPVEHTGEALAGALEPLLDDLGLQRFDLGGLCLGSSVACALARRRPGAVGRLLLHTPLLSPLLVRRRFHLQVAAMTAPGLYPAVVWLSRRRVVSDLYKRLMVEGADVDPRAADVNFRNQQRADPRALREWLRDGLRRHDDDLVAGRTAPTLVIAAAGDAIADVERLRVLVGAHPHVQMAVVDNAGHGWNDDFVRAQCAVIGAFLDDRPLPRRGLAEAAGVAAPAGSGGDGLR